MRAEFGIWLEGLQRLLLQCATRQWAAFCQFAA